MFLTSLDCSGSFFVVPANYRTESTVGDRREIRNLAYQNDFLPKVALYNQGHLHKSSFFYWVPSYVCELSLDLSERVTQT